MAADFPAATWAMRPFTLAAMVLIIAAPWYVLAGIRTHGDFWRVFIWQHNVQYILHPQQGHAGSSLYYFQGAYYEGEPSYIGAFVSQGQNPGLLVVAVAIDGCRPLNIIREKL